MALRSKDIGLVAQLVRAPPCHGGGRRFESDRGRNVEIFLKLRIGKIYEIYFSGIVCLGS